MKFQYLAVYFVLSLINLKAKLAVTSAWFSGVLVSNHDKLLAFEYTNNEQSRILQYYVPEFLHKLFGMTIPDAYLLQRWLLVTITFLCFHLYLKKWFDDAKAFAAVVFLAAILPLTYFNHLQESAPLLMLMFLLVLWAIRERRDIAYAGLLLVGAMANETILILPAVYWFYNIPHLDLRKNSLNSFLTVSGKTLLTCLPAYAFSAFIRWVTRDNEHLGGAWHLPDNLAGIAEHLSHSPLQWWSSYYLYIFFVFGAFWVFAWLKWGRKPLFLQRAMLMVPIFVIAHMLTGIILEVRQMIPLGFILIPMAMMYLFADEATPAKPSKQKLKTRK